MSNMQIGSTNTGCNVNGNINNNNNNNIIVKVNSSNEDHHRQINFQFYAPDPNFVGRRDELLLMRNAVINHQNEPGHRSPVIVVCGMGGVGKTELVRKFIEENRSVYKNIIWINSAEQSKMREDFETATDSLDISEKVKQKGFNYFVGEAFNRLSATQTIIVFDNIDETKNDEIVKVILKIETPEYRPHVVITSRIREWSESVHLLLIKLDVFNRNDALEYVSTRLKNAYAETHRSDNRDTLEDKLELVKTMQHFPLALKQATAHIRYQREEDVFFISHYIRAYTLCQKRILDSKHFQGDDFNLYKETTLTTWTVTITAIKKSGVLGELACRILRIIAYFDPDRIRRDIFFHLKCDVSESKIDTKTVIAAVRLLLSYSMITSQEGQSVLSIHRLVQQVIKIELESDKDLLRRTLCDSLGVLSKTEDFQEFPDHAIPVFFESVNFDELPHKYKTFPIMIIKKLINCGKYTQAINFSVDMCQYQCRFGDDWKDTLYTTTPGLPHQNLRIYTEAIKQRQETFGNLLLKFGQPFLHTMNYNFNTNTLCLTRNDIDANLYLLSKSLFKLQLDATFDKQSNDSQRSLMDHDLLEEQKINDDHPRTCAFKTATDVKFFETNGTSEQMLINRVAELDENSSGPYYCDGPYINKSAIDFTYSKESGKSEEFRLIQTSFEERSSYLEENHSQIVKSHIQIEYNRKVNNPVRHRMSEENVFEESTTSLGTCNRNVNITKSQLDIEYSRQDNGSETLYMHQHFFEDITIDSETDHPHTRIIRPSIDIIYHKEADNSEKLEIHQHGFVEHQHQQSLRFSSNVTASHNDEEKNSVKLRENTEVFPRLLKYKQPTINKRQRKLGEYLPSLMNMKYNIAVAYSKLGRHPEALQMHQEIFEKRKITSGEEDPDTLDSKFNVAVSYSQMGNHLKAIEILQEVLQLRKALWGDSHPITVESISQIADLYHILGEHATAIQMYGEIMVIRNITSGEEHPDTILSKRSIDFLQKILMENKPLREVKTFSTQNTEMLSRVKLITLSVIAIIACALYSFVSSS